jgi:3-hydroxymyristoyl/3-hydroxydecanoyl-(acyl carrier protein) dehydratase
MSSPNAFPGFPAEPQLPHQAPFRLVDRIVSAEVTRGYLVAERRLTLNDALWPAESQSSSHFFTAAPPGPGPLVFPPTLLIEALCQAAACLNSLTLTPPAASPAPVPQHHGMLVAIRDFKFPAFAYVGETLALFVQQKERLGSVIAFAVRATATPAAPPPSTPTAQDPEQPRQVASGRLLFAVTLA